MKKVIGKKETRREKKNKKRKRAEREKRGKEKEKEKKREEREPVELTSDVNFPNLIIKQLEVMPYLIVQGPPGTGKTHKIAQTVKKLLSENKSVLVTALTNRALMEVVSKPDLADLLEQKKVFTPNLSLDEVCELPQLDQASSVETIIVFLMFSSFYF